MERYIVIYGPRRSGTNYLSELFFMNLSSSGPKLVNLDNVPNEKTLKEKNILNLVDKYGSKHDLEDRDINQKFLNENINLFIARGDFSTWVNSLSRYISSFNEKFIPNEDFVLKAHRQYIRYFKFLSDNSKNINCSIIFYEKLSLDLLQKIANKNNFQLKQKLVNVSTRMFPSGIKSNKKYIPFDYDNNSEISKLTLELFNRKIGDNICPIGYLEKNEVNIKNLNFL